MIGTPGRVTRIILPALGCLSLSVLAQEPTHDAECSPDEIDMGDYCARRPTEAAQLKPGARRATPFRLKSMMPGIVGEMPADGLMPGLDREAVKSTRTGSGFGVQLGVYSSRETAVRVARDAESQVGGIFTLVRITRDQRILWACIHGPFPDETSAANALHNLRKKTGHKEAFIKPLEDMELLELDYASTEE